MTQEYVLVAQEYILVEQELAQNKQQIQMANQHAVDVNHQLDVANQVAADAAADAAPEAEADAYAEVGSTNLRTVVGMQGRFDLEGAKVELLHLSWGGPRWAVRLLHSTEHAHRSRFRALGVRARW